MSNIDTTEGLGEQPANDAANTAQETSAKPESGNIISKFDSLSEADRNAILFPEEEAQDDEYGLPADEITQDTTDDEEATATEVAPTEAASQPGKAPKRVSVRALPDDQQVLVARAVEMVRKGEAPDILTAAAMLGGSKQDQGADTQGAETEGQQQEQAAAQPDPINSIQERLTSLREQRKAAILEYDGEKQAELTDSIEETIAELSEAKAQARLNERDAQAQAQTYQQQYQKSVEEIEALYPDLEDDDSAFSRVFDGMIASGRARNPQAYGDAAELRDLADEVAGILNQRPARTNQTRTPLPAQPRPSVPNGSAVAPGHTQASRITSDEAMRYLKNASLEQLDALIDG